MNVDERIKKLKILEKMESNPKYSKKLGLKDVSDYKSLKTDYTERKRGKTK